MSSATLLHLGAAASVALLVAGCAAPSARTKLPEHQVGFQGSTWAAVDAELERTVSAGEVPGAVVSIAKDGVVVYERAVGKRDADGNPMSTSTVFDVASLAKPVATASAVALLICDGSMSEDDGLDRATVADTLVHQTDLPQYAAWEDIEPFRSTGGSPAEAVSRWLIERQPARHRHGYSNIGYILLAGEVERHAGTSMESMLRERLWGPLDMETTTFDPARLAGAEFAAAAADIAPGTPFDPLADWVAKRFPGHTAGHSGLFSTAHDLTVFCQTLLNAGDSSAKDVECVARTLFGNAVAPVDPGDDAGTAQLSATARSRGFNKIDSNYDGPIYWHTGYTGCVVWMNAKTGVSVVILTNTTLTRPDGWDNMRGAILKIVNKGTVRPHGQELYDPEIYTPGSDAIGILRIRL